MFIGWMCNNTTIITGYVETLGILTNYHHRFLLIGLHVFVPKIFRILFPRYCMAPNFRGLKFS